MNRRLRISGVDVAVDGEPPEKLLAEAYARHEHPVCLCCPEGVAMYIARLGDRHILKRMPGTGPQHDVDCDSYEPPSGLSGDGPSRVYQRFVVPAGKHEIATRMRDTARVEGFDHEKAGVVTLAADQNLVIDFHPGAGGFVFR